MTYTLIKFAFKVSDVANKASSDYLMSLCHSAYFHYVDDVVLVYAIVKDDMDVSGLNGFPVVDFNFDMPKLEEVNNFEQDKVDVINGLKKGAFEIMGEL